MEPNINKAMGQFVILRGLVWIGCQFLGVVVAAAAVGVRQTPILKRIIWIIAVTVLSADLVSAAANNRPRDISALRAQMSGPVITDTARQAQDITRVGHIGENVEDVVIIDGLAYCATGYGFAVFDVSDPAATHKISELYFTGSGSAIQVDRGYAFVTADPSGLHVIDIRDPYQPLEVNVYPYGGTAIALKWPYAYLGEGYEGVRILDVSNPRQIIEKSIYYQNWGFSDFVWAIKLYSEPPSRNDNRLYMFVSDLETGVRVVDVSDPVNPLHIAEVGHPDVYDIELTERYAYFSGRGLWIYEIPDPSAFPDPGAFVEVYANPDLHPNNIFIRDHYLYGVDLPDFFILDTTDPVRPVKIAQSNIGGFGGGFTQQLILDDKLAYMTLGMGGLRIYDLTELSQPTALFLSDPPGFAYDVQVRDGYAFVADLAAGVVAVDIRQPNAPRLVGQSRTSVSANAVAIALAGSYAYVAGWLRGLWIFDISDPANITMAGFYDAITQVTSAFIVDNYAYVVDEYAGLHILDISDPGQPSLLGHFREQYRTQYGGLEVRGNYAFLIESDPDRGIRVLNIEDPTSPQAVSFYSTNGWGWDISLCDRYAYLPGYAGFQILDIGDPERIELIGRYIMVDNFQSSKVTIHGNHAYVPSGTGLDIVDISSPRSPIRVASQTSMKKSHRAVVAGSHIYLANDHAGLTVLSADEVSIVDEDDPTNGGRRTLLQNYPNPCNLTTTIGFNVGHPAPVVLSIYSVSGQLVKTLLNGDVYPTGPHFVTWDGTSASGQTLANGLYFYQLKINNVIEVKRLTLLQN